MAPSFTQAERINFAWEGGMRAGKNQGEEVKITSGSVGSLSR